MAGLYEGLEQVPDPAAVAAAPPPPPKPSPLYEGLEVVPAAPNVPIPAQREASGVLEHLQAGFQASATGLAWRRRLPELVINPEHATWWERASTGIAQVASELPIMALGAAGGAPTGAAIGGAVGGPAAPATAVVGGVLGAGAGMFALPAGIRQSLILAYGSGEIKTAGDWWNAVRQVATEMGKEGAIGALTMGSGAIAARIAGKAIAPAIGQSLTVGQGTTGIGVADVAAQIAAMTTIPAAMQGRLPDLVEFMDAAIVIAGLKGAHVTAEQLAKIYVKTGRTPAEQVADAQGSPEVADAIAAGQPEPARTADGRLEMPQIQENLFRETARLTELEKAAEGGPLSAGQLEELQGLKGRIAELERQLGERQVTPATEPTYTPDQAKDAQARGEARLTELTEKAKTAPLTDQERAERVFLTAASKGPAEALARHFGIQPEGAPSAGRLEAGAQRVYDDVRRQLRETDEQRRAASITPLGDEHADAVAALVRARIRTRAERLGVDPWDLYQERPLQIRDATAKEMADAEKIPDGAPTFTPPAVDLFGDAIEPQRTPRFGVEGLETKELPLEKLVLSKEVPQFKAAADEQGVIVPLGGKFDRTGVGPIQVWERTDGTLEVVSGRHRLDLARRSGETTIPAQIHREAEGFTARQAATLDAQLNIREEQGSVADYAQYFKDAGITEAGAQELGLLARAKGRTGFAIARDASGDLLEAHRAGLLSDEAALAVSAAAPGSERLQALGIAMLNQGKSILIAVNTMKAVDVMAAERMAKGAQGDIFGFDDSAMREAAAMAKRATAIQRKIGEQIAAVSGASKRPELARRMGVDVQDPEGIQKKIVQLRQEQYLWDNWPLYPELVAKLRSPDITGREGELQQGPVPPIYIEDEAGGPLLDHRGQIALVEPKQFMKVGGTTFWEHTMVDEHGKPAGLLALGWKDGKVTQLINVHTFASRRNEGLASRALAAILQHNPPDAELLVRYIQKDARDWWGRRGTRIFESEGGEDGTLTRQDFERASAARPGEAPEIPPGEAAGSPPGEPVRAGREAAAEAQEARALEQVAPPAPEAPGVYGFDRQPETPAEKDARDALAAEQAARRRDEVQAKNLNERGKDGRFLKNKKNDDPNTLFQDAPSEPRTWWYSALRHQIAQVNMKSAPASGWKDLLKGLASKGVKADEIKWSGIEEWLDLQKGRVTKEQVDAYLRANGVRVSEQRLGGPLERTAGDPEIAAELARLKDAGYYLDQDPAAEVANMPGERARWGILHNENGDIFADAFDVRDAFGEIDPSISFEPSGSRDVWNVMQYGRQQWQVSPAASEASARAIALREHPEIKKIPPEHKDLARDLEKVLEHMNGGEDGPSTKFSQYQTPGGKDYRELLLTLPQGEGTLPKGYSIKPLRGATDDAAKTIGDLQAEWNKWLAEHNIAPVSADEVLRADWDRVGEAGQRYIYGFRERWDDAMDADRRASKFTLVGPDGVGHALVGDTPADAMTAAMHYLSTTGAIAKQQFTESHWDAPNVLAHVRFNEREIQSYTKEQIADIGKRLAERFSPRTGEKGLGSGATDVAQREGLITPLEAAQYSHARSFTSNAPYTGATQRVLFVEEIQSDWAQQGKRKGFAADRSAILAEHTAAMRDFDRLRNEGLLGEDPRMLAASERVIAANNAVRESKGGEIPSGPFVQKTEAWVGLTIKRLIAYAAEHGYDKVAWTTGAQQAERYTSALRKAVDVIEWKKTEKGVQLVGYKGKGRGDELSGAETRQREAVDRILAAEDYLGFDTAREARQSILDHNDWPDRWTVPQADVDTIVAWRAAVLAGRGRREKVVDTTEKEDALSDAIGKSMAQKILSDPNPEGVIEGGSIMVSDTGMASFYDRIVPNVANEILRKLGGGRVGEFDVGIRGKASAVEARPDIPLEALTPMTRGDRDVFAGAENFSDGGIPLMTDTTVLLNGERHDVTVIIDRTGVQIHGLGEDPEIGPVPEFALRLGSPMFPADAGRSQAKAQAFLEDAWASEMFWHDLKLIHGEVPGDGPGGIKQPGFDVTPAMVEKAKAGLPLFQQRQDGPDGPRGTYQIAENLVTTMRLADKSTVVHELGHSWLEEMKADAGRPGAPAGVRGDWETLRRELAIPESGDIPRSSHEQFSRSVERYLAEGEAPARELRSVFQRFKEWLLEIYRTVTAFGVEINPALKGVLDRMLASDEEIAAARDLGVPRAYVAEAKQVEARKIVPGFKAEQISMEPYADELPAGPGKAPKDTHVNYAYINTPTDVKLTMQRMAEIDQENIQAQRGGTDGVKSWEQSNAEQAKYLNDVLGGSEDTLRILAPRRPNESGPDVRLGILKKLAVGAAEDSARLRDIVLARGHDATVLEQLQYLGSIERARMIQAEFLGERASVARALNALKDATEGSGEIARMLEVIGVGELHQEGRPRTPAEEQAYLKKQLDEILQRYKGRSALDIAKLHKEIGTLKGTYEFARALERATTWEMLIEGWKSGLLSGPVTHTTNLFGTGAYQAFRAPVDMLAAVIGSARGASVGMGEGDRASMSEAVARLTGWLGGTMDGVRAGVAAFNANETTGKTESYRNAIPGRFGELWRIPLRLMSAEDAMVTTMYRRGELHTLAIRQAFDEGLSPATREFAERVSALRGRPTPEMEAIADQASTRMTFNAPLGEKGVALQLFVNKWNLQWMIPFIRTPINITKEVGRMSVFAPLVGEWRAAMRAGGVERDRAIAEMALGTGLMAVTMAYAFSGQITGAGSPDPGKQRGKAGVSQPYSGQIGDTWYEYARIQPMGTLMGIAADLANVWDHATDEEKDKVPRMLAVAFSNAVTNQTFLQGITNFVNAMSEPQRFGPRFIQQFAGSLVPNIIGQPTAMADPVVREVNGAVDAIKARVPGFRQELLPKRDWLGEEVKTKERMGGVLPVREQKISDDKVRLEAARLDLSMAAAPKKTHLGKGTGKIGDVELTPEERDLFERVGGEMAHKILGNIVNAPGYDEIPDLVKRRIFSRVLSASHQVAAAAALAPEKRVAYLQSISEKMAAELAPAPESQ